MKTEKSAGVVVFRRTEKGNMYLILENSSNHHWDFAKGNIEPGESDDAAAMREMKEEAGLEKVELMPGFKESMNYFYRLKGEPIDKTVVMFLGEEKAGEDVKLSWEHSRFEWVSCEEAMSKLTKHKKELIQKAENFLSGRFENWTKD